MGGVKFCKDCKWHTMTVMTVPDSRNSECRHPEFGEGRRDLVTGDEIRIVRRCSDVRADEALCGEHAKWFEPK